MAGMPSLNIDTVLNPPKQKGKSASETWPEYINKKLEPVWGNIRAGAGQGSRAYGPLKEPIDTAFDYLASRKIGPQGFEIAEPMEDVKARREKLAKDYPEGAEAGYKVHGLLRDRMVPVARAADWVSNLRYGSGVGAASQGLEEYDAAVNRGLPLNPFESAERVGAAGTGGAIGAALLGGGARRVPGIGNDMKTVPGGPMNAEQLTALAQAAQKARLAGDTAPDLAQLMRLSQDVRLGKRAPDVEAMYRRARPVVVDDAEIAKHAVPGGGNRLTGRLNAAPKEGRAEVAQEVLDQLRARAEPGGFNTRGDRLAGDVEHADRVIARRAADPRYPDITPPTLPVDRDLPQRITTTKRDIYDQAVEAARVGTPPRTLAEGQTAVGSPNQLGMWNQTLGALSPADARIAEQALASIGRARGSDPARTGSGPPGIGNAWRDRNKAQGALDEHGEVQRSIGESFPYKPGEPPQLTITPPFTTKGFRLGAVLPGPSGAASAGTTKSFKDPTAAAVDIGNKTTAEQWLAFLGTEVGKQYAPMFISNILNQEGHGDRYR